MSEFLFKLCGFSLIAAMAVMLLKRWGADFAIIVKLVAGICISGACIMAITPLIDFFTELCEKEGLVGYFKVLFEVLCVAIITHICASVCRDCGENSLAGYVELGGKIEILLLSLPLMRRILDLVSGLVQS